jgi:hypothetical protein
LVGAERIQALNTIHNNMNNQRYDQVTRAYKFFDEGVAAGRDPRELYIMARKELVNTADPVRANRWLESQGITEQPSEDAINKMAALATYGLHDAPTSRQEHLLEVEWSYRQRVAAAEARAKGPEDLRTKYPDANEIKNLGNMLSGYIQDFDDFQGGVDDAGNHVGERGKIVSTIANWSTLAQRNQILGDPGVTPVDYQRIGADIINFARQDLTEEGWFFGTANTGDTFHGHDFMNAADTAMGILEVERAAMAARGVNMSIYDIWKQKSPQIMARIKNTHVAMGQQGYTAGGTQSDSGAGSAAENVAQSPQDTQEKPATPAKSMSRRQEINKQIAGMSVSEKFQFTDKGKIKTPAYQRLLDERKALDDVGLYGGA